MKRLIQFLLVIVLAMGGKDVLAQGCPMIQITQQTIPFSTQSYGAVTVTAIPWTLPVVYSPPGVAACFPSPASRIAGGSPPSPGAINFLFAGKRVTHVRIFGVSINRNEWMTLYVNNTTIPYVIQPTDVHSLDFNGPSTGITPVFTCPASTLPANGPCQLIGGRIEGPTVGPGASPFNGCIVDVTDCGGIRNLLVESNSLPPGGGGMEITVFFDTCKQPGCSDAKSNSPCEGDTLRLYNEGDSVGATYLWTGPVGFSSTEQNPIVYGTSLTPARSGLYTSYKFQGSVSDTDTVRVVVHPRPFVKTTTLLPFCVSTIDTIELRAATPGITGETYYWTGPNLFTSTLQNPNIMGISPADTGLYKVVVTTPFGCTDSGTVDVQLRPMPVPPTIIGPSPYCFGDPFVPFTTSGVVPGANVLWYTTTVGGVGSTTSPVINTSVAGTTKVYASQKEGLYCESLRDSLTIVVKPEIKPSFTWNTVLGCTSDIVTFNNTSVGADWYSWSYGDGLFSPDTTTLLTTQITYKLHKVHTAKLTAYTVGCEKSATGYVNTTHSVKAAFWPKLDTFCAGGWTTMDDSTTSMIDTSVIIRPSGAIDNLFGTSATVDTSNVATDPAGATYLAANYAWDFGDGTVDVTNTRIPPAHRYDSGGAYIVKLTVTDSIGCVDTIAHELYAIRLKINTFHDTLLCISQPLLMYNEVKMNPLLGDLRPSFVYSWTPASFLDDTTKQNPFYWEIEATTTYTFTATEPKYGCFTYDTVRVQSVRGIKIANVTPDITIPYGRSVQMNSDSMVYYFWKNNDGTLDDPNVNNPIATPLATTVYAVYGYDKNGCLDSAYVKVTVDSSMIEDIPSGFSPNGDGLNDIFRPVGLKYQSLVDFRVYNRLGQQVYYTSTYGNGWDGKFNGVPQDLGTYSYVIIVGRPGGDGRNVVYKGTVTLVR